MANRAKQTAAFITTKPVRTRNHHRFYYPNLKIRKTNPFHLTACSVRGVRPRAPRCQGQTRASAAHKQPGRTRNHYRFYYPNTKNTGNEPISCPTSLRKTFFRKTNPFGSRACLRRNLASRTLRVRGLDLQEKMDPSLRQNDFYTETFWVTCERKNSTVRFRPSSKLTLDSYPNRLSLSIAAYECIMSPCRIGA